MRFTRFSFIVAAICITAFSSLAVLAQKAELTDVIAKHKASVGTPAELAAVKNQLIVSDAQFTFKGSTVVVAGKGLILSTGDRSLWAMNFTSNDYPQDRFGFDGKSVKVGKATPNAKSLIGDFLENNRVILKDGLLGGTLSASWPLFNSNLRGAKIRPDGTKTINGKETIVLTYEPKGSSDLSIKLFFDADTSQHVRTEYLLLRAAGQGSNVDNSASQSGTIFRLTEEFSDYAKMGDLLLPSLYKITYSRTTTAGTATSQTTNRDAEWTFKVTDIGFNRELDAGSFSIDQK